MAEESQNHHLRLRDILIVPRENLQKAIAGTVVGNFMEWYDVGVYGYLAVTIGKVFLANTPSHIQNLFSLGVFAVTFIARPLGGVILGSLGDRVGRQKVLSFTLLAMSSVTFLIGLLPGFNRIGLWAPLILIILKLLQGFSTGGEYAGATTMVTEYAPDARRGFYSSLLDMGSYFGFAFGALVVSLLELHFMENIMTSWGWRIPFLLALPFASIAIYFRSKVEDTPIYRQVKKVNQQEFTGSPEVNPKAVELEENVAEGNVRQLIKYHWHELLLSFTLVAAANTMGYTLTTYMPTYLSTTLHYNETQSNLITLPILIALSLFIPIGGHLSDHFGRKRLLTIGACGGAILVLPAFLLMKSGSLTETFIGLFLLAIPIACMIPNLASALPSLFPTSLRYSGMGISYNLAVAIFAGTAPFIMEALVTLSGNPLAPAFWIIFTSICGIIAATFMTESAGKPLPGASPIASSKSEARDIILAEDLKVMQQLRPIAEARHCTVVQLLVAWLIKNPDDMQKSPNYEHFVHKSQAIAAKLTDEESQKIKDILDS